MAMDYLPIQASSVPCEHIFSSSAETDTKHWNCINPVLMEVLQMYKLFLKKQCLNFMEGWMTEEKLLSADTPDNDLLAGLLNSEPDILEDAEDTIIQYMDQYETEVEGVAQWARVLLSIHYHVVILLDWWPFPLWDVDFTESQ